MRTANRPTICLGLDVLPHTGVLDALASLRSFAGRVDEYFVVDWGVTEETLALLVGFFDEVGALGRVVPGAPGLARSHTWSLGLLATQANSEYLCLIEAGEELVGELELGGFSFDAGMLRVGRASDAIYRTRLIRRVLGFRYLDERWVTSDRRGLTLAQVPGDYRLEPHLSELDALDPPSEAERSLEALEASARALGNSPEAFRINARLLRHPLLPESERARIEVNRDCSAPAMENELMAESEARKRALLERRALADARGTASVTLTVTTCRRWELFVRAMDSFISACDDIARVARFICIDDGSSASDRAAMAARYPFFEFILKSPEERGHARSMNLLRRAVDTKYWLHIEDDFQFFERRPFVSEAIAILEHDGSLQQVLFNRAYAELTEDRSLDAGELRSLPDGSRYWAHEYDPSARQGGMSLAWWPHFASRPSLMVTERIFAVGEFNEGPVNLEREFGERFFAQGGRSGFLDTIAARHIGPLVDARGRGLLPNAYQLNGQLQYGQDPSAIEVTAVIWCSGDLASLLTTCRALDASCVDRERIADWVCSAADDRLEAHREQLAERAPFLRILPSPGPDSAANPWQRLLSEVRGRYALCLDTQGPMPTELSIAKRIATFIQSDAEQPWPQELREPTIWDVERAKRGANELTEASREQAEWLSPIPPLPPGAEWHFDVREWVVAKYDRDGRPHGALLRFRDTGRLAARYDYRHGQRCGPFQAYHPSGALAQTGRYFLGELDGLLTAYSDPRPHRFAEVSLGPERGIVKREYRRGVLLAEAHATDAAESPVDDVREREHDLLSVPYDFWPAFETIESLHSETEPARVEQPFSALSSAIARAAERVMTCRAELSRRGARELPPDVSQLSAGESARPRRYSFSFTGADGALVVVQVNELLDVSELTPSHLAQRTQLEWAGLCWLCWAAGRDAVERPCELRARPELHEALLGVAIRLEQLAALAVSELPRFHRLDEMRLPASALAHIAALYREIRAVLLFAVDPDCQSPWQDDLGRDSA